MTRTRWIVFLLLLCGVSVGEIVAEDVAAEDVASAKDTLPSEASSQDVSEEEPFKVSLTEKWSVLVNPANPRPGLTALSKKSPIQNVDEFSFTGPMVGHPFGLGDFAADGRWALVDGVAQPTEGKNALMHLAAADQFEMEGIIQQQKFGGWLMLLGWNQGHGYSLSNVTLKESGSPWFICEYRGSKAIEETNQEVKQFEWKDNQPFRMVVKEKKLSVAVGKTFIVEDYPLENYTAGDVFLGTYDTRYGPKPIAVRSLRIRAAVDAPEKGTKSKKSGKKPAASKKTAADKDKE